MKGEKGSKYEDLIEAVKAGVEREGAGVAINGMRKTKAGDLLLLLENGSGKAHAVREEVSKISNIRATAITNVKMVNILDLEATASTDDMKEGVRAALKTTLQLFWVTPKQTSCSPCVK